jgi:hypothetical protein
MNETINLTFQNGSTLNVPVRIDQRDGQRIIRIDEKRLWANPNTGYGRESQPTDRKEVQLDPFTCAPEHISNGNRNEETMDNKGFRLVFGLGIVWWLISAVCSMAFFATIVYIAWHFIHKFW